MCELVIKGVVLFSNISNKTYVNTKPMKRTVLFLIPSFFVFAILMMSCGEQSKQNTINIKEDIKKFNKDLKEGTVNTSEDIKVSVTNEWEHFKTTSENTLKNTATSSLG